MSKSYSFRVAGQFAGVTSFTDDDGEDVNFLKIDYFGGSQSIPVPADKVDIFNEKSIGCDVRASGTMVVSKGAFRPVLSSLSFEGDKNFELVTMEESMSGMVMHGPANLVRKNSFKRKDGQLVCEGVFWLYGGSFTLQCDPACYARMEPGLCSFEAQVLTEVSSSVTPSGKREVKTNNWVHVMNVSPMGQKRK